MNHIIPIEVRDYALIDTFARDGAAANGSSPVYSSSSSTWTFLSNSVATPSGNVTCVDATGLTSATSINAADVLQISKPESKNNYLVEWAWSALNAKVFIYLRTLLGYDAIELQQRGLRFRINRDSATAVTITTQKVNGNASFDDLDTSTITTNADLAMRMSISMDVAASELTYHLGGTTVTVDISSVDGDGTDNSVFALGMTPAATTSIRSVRNW